MVNGNATTQVQTPRKIEVPLIRVATGVAVGLSEVAAEFVDEKRNKPATDITAVQNLLPIIGTGAGIVMGLMKNKSIRKVGNDLAVGYGAIATLKLGNLARSTIQARKLKKLRQISIQRGGPSANRQIAGSTQGYISTMSMA